MNFDYIIQTGQYKKTALSLSMVNHSAPLSITETEANYLIDFIKKHNLKSAYELCTGFGISSVAIGLGLKETGGTLITVDGYMEENSIDFLSYKSKLIPNPEADGFKSVKNLIKLFELENVVFPCVGISPQIIPQTNPPELDFVFIDSLHSPEFCLRDLQGIEPYINKSHYAVFLHDTGCVIGHKLTDYVKETFNKEIYLIPELTPPDGYYMGVISNL